MGAAQNYSDEELILEVCRIVESRTGTQLGPKQHNMVRSRLRRRLSDLHMASFELYRAHLEKTPKETDILISLLTTHHTYFFREFVHFEHVENILPALVQRARARGSNRLDVLSAACSAGQEVYSLAMHLKKHLGEIAPDFTFRVFGSDVDGESVKLAQNGVYRFEEIKTVPLKYLGDHWARGKGAITDFVKARNSLRDNCEFTVMNLLDPRELADRKFDLVFCRNVFIYFNSKQIRAVTANLMRHLQPGGQLILGLSETLHGLDLPLKTVGPSIYVRDEETQAVVRPVPAATVAPATAPLRVVCIDDSTSIISLLQHILGKEDGFEVVGTASNGEEGRKIVAEKKPDVVTLDLHMPVCDGLKFLETKGQGSVPVVVVSSVSRDDAGLALKALRLGASDYVEKPALNNLERRADELRAKLRAAFKVKSTPVQITHAVDEQFARHLDIKNREKCLRVVLFSMSDYDRCVRLVREARVQRVPLLLTAEGAGAVLPEICERLALETGQAVTVATNGSTTPKPGEAVALDWQALGKSLPTLGYERISVLVVGEVSTHGARDLISLPGVQILLEDTAMGEGAKILRSRAADIVPATSFSYFSDSFFAYGMKESK